MAFKNCYPLAGPKAREDIASSPWQPKHLEVAGYKPVIDVLVDSGCFETIYFDRENELPITYREIGLFKRSPFQERAEEGRDLVSPKS